MGFNARLNPESIVSPEMASCATNSSARIPFFIAPRACQILSAKALNGTTTSIVSGTTTGSSVDLYLCKNSTSTGSRIASFNGSGTTVATQGTAVLTLSTSTALSRLAAGDILFFEFVGVANNNASNAGLKLQVDYMYAYGADDTATP